MRKFTSLCLLTERLPGIYLLNYCFSTNLIFQMFIRCTYLQHSLVMWENCFPWFLTLVPSAWSIVFTAVKEPHECRSFPCLIFEDNFDELDTDTWEHEITMSGGGVSHRVKLFLSCLCCKNASSALYDFLQWNREVLYFETCWNEGNSIELYFHVDFFLIVSRTQCHNVLKTKFQRFSMIRSGYYCWFHFTTPAKSML